MRRETVVGLTQQLDSAYASGHRGLGPFPTQAKGDFKKANSALVTAGLIGVRPPKCLD